MKAVRYIVYELQLWNADADAGVIVFEAEVYCKCLKPGGTALIDNVFNVPA